MNLNEILMSDNPLLEIYDNLKELLELIPELKDMIGFDQKNPAHDKDVWNHTMYAIGLSPKNLDIRMALLFHDIGKPNKCIEDGNIRHFPDHPKESERITQIVLERLNYPQEFINRICYLVRKHDDLITKEEIRQNKELESTRLIIQICDLYAHNLENPKVIKKEVYITKIKKYMKEINNE